MRTIGVVTVLLGILLVAGCEEPLEIDLAGSWTISEVSSECPGVEAQDIVVLNADGGQITSITVTQDEDVTTGCTVVAGDPGEVTLDPPLSRYYTRRGPLQAGFNATFEGVSYSVASYTSASITMSRPGIESAGVDPNATITETWVHQ